jgi:hypothetical protein
VISVLAIPTISTAIPLFCESKFLFKDYLVPPDKFKKEHKPNKNLCLPLNVDSEYYAPGVDDYKTDSFRYRDIITIQIKHIHEDDSAIFVHPAFAAEHEDKLIRHPVAKHPLIFGDYLESYGHNVFIDRPDDLKTRELPTFLFVVYAHFALADIGPIVIDADYQDDLNRRFAFKRISMNRRLTCGRSGRVKMPWTITIDGHEFQIALKIIDTGAIHGVASYKDFCANSGVILDSKDLMKNWITRMDSAYFEVPEDFDNYSLGDLEVYNALQGNAETMREVWNSLNVGDYFEDPRLSIGATVAKIYESKVLQLFGVSPALLKSKKFKKAVFLERLTGKSNALFFSSKIQNNAYLLAKCDGGRCASNAPTTITIKGNLVDIDISGCYAASMSSQSMPFGVPVVYGSNFPRSKVLKGVPLREVLRAFKSDLVPGLWVMRIQVIGLTYELDLISSWFDMKRTFIKRTDSDQLEGEVDITSGSSKMFTREIHAGVLTSDTLDVINQLNPRHRDDFLDKCEVLALAFYPKSYEVTDLEKFKDIVEDTTKHKTFDSRSKVLGVLELVTQENSFWYRENLGEFFTDDIRAKRAMHPKKSPFNNMYKLIANTTYGVQVSRHFASSNVIVANNITSRVRAGMYLFEKALNLTGSITDGQGFNLDNVLYRARGKYLKTELLARMYAVSAREMQIQTAGKFGKLEIGEKTHANVDIAAYAHCCEVWPKSTLLNGPGRKLNPVNGQVAYEDGTGIFSFEMKQFADSVTIHGSSNYRFKEGNNETLKMRGYEKDREHAAFTIDDSNNIVWLTTYEGTTPAKVLFDQIEKNPHACLPLPPFIKTAILKPNVYALNYKNVWSSSPLAPGDNFIKSGRPSYFSLAQYKYQTLEQYTTWQKTHNRLKNRHGVSFELFFLNADGTLDYQRMILKLDEMVRAGVINPITRLDPHNNIARNKPAVIVAYKRAAELMKKDIKESMQGEEDSDDFDLIDTSDSWMD